MKIGILTMPLATNYGGILQAYALKTVLERMGHQVSFIERSRYLNTPWWKRYPLYAYRLFKRYVKRDKYAIIFYERENNRMLDEEKQVQKDIAPFINEYFKIRKVEKYTDIQSNEFDAIIVGSDQVWRHFYSRTIMGGTPATYLDFTKDWKIRRIAYAASFGGDWWEMDPDLTKLCSQLISKFDAVSVREVSGIKLCSDYLNYKKAVHVLDPTMLLGQSDYVQLFENKDIHSSGDLLCYILDENENKSNIIKRVAESYQLQPFNVMASKSSKGVKPSIESWLKGFYDAKYVITDSFHACVFSILFKKPFIVIGNSSRGVSRIQSLLSLFGLENCLVDESYTEVPTFNSVPKMEEFERMKAFSYTYLKNALS